MKWKDTRAQLVPQYAKFKSSCARCLLCLIVASKCARFARCFSVATKLHVLCNLLLYYIKWRTLFCLIGELMLRAHFGFSLIVAPWFCTFFISCFIDAESRPRVPFSCSSVMSKLLALFILFHCCKNPRARALFHHLSVVPKLHAHLILVIVAKSQPRVPCSIASLFCQS